MFLPTNNASPTQHSAPVCDDGAGHGGRKGFRALPAGGPEDRGSGKQSSEKPNYTIETVRRLKRSFKKSDRLFFLIGMDAFCEIAKWHQAEALFRECEFIVAGGLDIRWRMSRMHYLRL